MKRIIYSEKWQQRPLSLPTTRCLCFLLSQDLYVLYRIYLWSHFLCWIAMEQLERGCQDGFKNFCGAALYPFATSLPPVKGILLQFDIDGLFHCSSKRSAFHFLNVHTATHRGALVVLVDVIYCWILTWKTCWAMPFLQQLLLAVYGYTFYCIAHIYEIASIICNLPCLPDIPKQRILQQLTPSCEDVTHGCHLTSMTHMWHQHGNAWDSPPIRGTVETWKAVFYYPITCMSNLLVHQQPLIQ